jgi:hypothetical protein
MRNVTQFMCLPYCASPDAKFNQDVQATNKLVEAARVLILSH